MSESDYLLFFVVVSVYTIFKMKIDSLIKSQREALRWLDEKFDIRPVGSALGVQGVGF